MLLSRNPPTAFTPPIKPTATVAPIAISPAGISFAQRAGCRDVHAPVIFGHNSLAFGQAGYSGKLAVDFGHHALGVSVDPEHQHGRENRLAAHQNAGKDDRVGYDKPAYVFPAGLLAPLTSDI